MSTELATRGEQAVALQPQSEGAAILSVIAQAARDPNVDVAKMQALLEMRERIMDKEAEIAFTEAMNHVQSAVPRITKGRKIVVKGTLRSKYAALEDIDRELRPLIIENGFSLFYSTEDVPPKGTKLILTVKHRMGHKEPFSLVLPLDRNEYRSDIQNIASTVSFGKRILLCMAFNVITVDEDTDGHRAENYITEDQVLTIATLLRDCGLKENDTNFLAWAGADRLERIERTAYERIVAQLDKRLKGQRK